MFSAFRVGPAVRGRELCDINIYYSKFLNQNQSYRYIFIVLRLPNF